MPDLKSSRGFGCEVRTTWGHSKLFGSTGIFNCVMSRAQGSEVRGPFGFGSLNLFTFRHNLLDRAASPWTFFFFWGGGKCF